MVIDVAKLILRFLAARLCVETVRITNPVTPHLFLFEFILCGKYMQMQWLTWNGLVAGRLVAANEEDHPIKQQ